MMARGAEPGVVRSGRELASNRRDSFARSRRNTRTKPATEACYRRRRAGNRHQVRRQRGRCQGAARIRLRSGRTRGQRRPELAVCACTATRLAGRCHRRSGGGVLTSVSSETVMWLIALIGASRRGRRARSVTVQRVPGSSDDASEARVAALAAAIDDPAWEARIRRRRAPRSRALFLHSRVSLVVAGSRAAVARAGIRHRRLVVLGCERLAGRRDEQREHRTRPSCRPSKRLFDRAHVDAARARWRDADRLRARAKSNGVRNTSAFGRHLGPGSRWAGRRPWRVATRPGRPRTRQGNHLQGLGAGGSRPGPISRRLRER